MTSAGSEMMPLHRHAFVFDAHCDSLGSALPGMHFRDLRQWGDRGHIDLPRLCAGGINCQIFACFPFQSRLNAGPTGAVLDRLEALHLLLEQAPEQICLVQNARDLEQLRVDGPIGAILGLEGAEALEGSLSRLHTYFKLGVRNLGLSWNGRNHACDGVGVGSNFGLTAFGKEVVATCNRLGIMLDVSHLNAAGVSDVLKLSDKPIIASHSNARALHDHPRNLTDSQIRALADGGGVIGVTFVGMYLAAGQVQKALPLVADHIEYLVNLAGIEHVGIGSDFDGWELPEDLNSAEKYPRLTDELLRRGYAEEVIYKILGENFRRIFLQVLPR